MTEKVLVAFDFDHTMINDNSDTHIIRLAPNGELPAEICNMFDQHGWTKYMAAIFEYLHKLGIQKEDYEESVSEIIFVDGMVELLNYLSADQNIETIIISDANSFFISSILKRANLHHAVDDIFTNPAKFDDSGCLRLKYYHTQDWCDLSTVNLCKGHILQEYIKSRKEHGISFSQVYFIGDGGNDLCPMLTLSNNDVACIRKEHTLWKRMQKLIKAGSVETSHFSRLKAEVLSWNSGLDIIKKLESFKVLKV